MATAPNPQKEQARKLMLREFERIGMRYHQHADGQLELLRERQDIEHLWRLAGFGDPPPFEPLRTMAGVA